MTDRQSTPERERAIMIRPKLGQIILTAILFVIVATIVGSSVISAQSHEAEKSAVFATEADGTAMTLVQRESFGVMLALDSWARGTSTARDVQIARAVLGQRLGVVTSSGSPTYDLTGDKYHATLDALDIYLSSLTSIPDADRFAHREAITATVAAFATQTRELTMVFQELSRMQVQNALQDRVTAELWQSGLSGLAFALGIALFVWFGIDINRAYRRSARQLAVQRAELDSARERLILLQRIDERSRLWMEAVNSGASRESVFESIRADIAQIVPGLLVDVRYESDTPIRVITRPEFTLGDEDDDAIIARAVETVRLIVVRDSGEEELAFQRMHDSLTGLPNRIQFDPIVAERLAETEPRDRSIAVMLVDIDRFSDFNGSLGHEAGDVLLLAVANALRAAAPSAVHVARLSSDEFGLVGSFASAELATSTIRAIVDAVDFEWEHEGVRTHVTASAGVALATPGDDPGVVVQRAAAAIHLAKARGERSAFVMFDEVVHEKLLTTMHEESALRAAMRAGEFIVHFQPIMALATGLLAGAEALVRWQRPGVGLVSPNDFLPAVSRAGLSAELGWEVIEQALRAWGRLLRGHLLDQAGGRTPYVSINVDPAQLDLPGLADFILTAARRYQVPASCVVVEVTEHALAGSRVAIEQLTELRSNGVRIALDDFGTGYSSLSQASSLPLDILKIDQSFVPSDIMGEQNRALIGDICRIGATLGLNVTAEGVETEVVAASLRELGVDYGQGYLYSKAIPEGTLAEWLAERSEPLEVLPLA